MELQSSSQISKIAPALLQAQRKMGSIAKDGKNPYFKSNFVTLNAVREALIPVLNDCGIMVLQPMVYHEGKTFIRTVFLHESGEYLASETEVVVVKEKDPQAYGSGISYTRRYSLLSMACSAGEDDDGEKAQSRSTPMAKPPVKAALPVEVPPSPPVVLEDKSQPAKVAEKKTFVRKEAPKWE